MDTSKSAQSNNSYNTQASTTPLEAIFEATARGCSELLTGHALKMHGRQVLDE
jgi:hypothetical protein